jgi:hypothetical protein
VLCGRGAYVAYQQAIITREEAGEPRRDQSPRTVGFTSHRGKGCVGGVCWGCVITGSNCGYGLRLYVVFTCSVALQGDRILIPCNDVDRRLESDLITGS